MLQKDIAYKYQVSPAYVSKLNNGKKQIFVPVVNKFVETKLASIERHEIIKFLKNQIEHHEYQITIYKTILNKLGGQ